MRFAAVIWLAVAAAVAQEIPPGTALPVVLSTKINISGAQRGETIVANLAQSVPLPSKTVLRSGARVTGRVLQAGTNRDGSDFARMEFDMVHDNGRDIPVRTSLRVLASPSDVHNAQLPIHGPIGAENEETWTTTQIGGDDVYRGGGHVVHGEKTVGDPVAGGVMAELTALPGTPCATGSQGRRLALWVFGSSACGVYGFPHLYIAAHGDSDPKGEIVLRSFRRRTIPRGSALLLITVEPGPAAK